MSIQKREIVYKTVDGVELAMHIFKPADHEGDEPLAAIVFFFGGGWSSGTPEQFFPHCEHLAELGMFAASAEYRVKSRHGVTPDACVADGKSAVRYLYAHADELGIDINRIAAGGGSAGGHVAACTALVEGRDDPTDNLQMTCMPCAMVLFNPVIDTSPEGFGNQRFDGPAMEFSPVHLVRPGIPPTVVFHGEGDTTVPCDRARAFKKAMDATGNDCTLHVYEGQAHGFFNLNRGQEIYDDTVEKMDAFLKRLGFLSS